MTDNKVKIETGIVGFFDILGYQSFLNQDLSEEVATDILSIINSIDSETIKDLGIFFPSIVKLNLTEKLKEEYKWLTFSDTILLTSVYLENETNDEKLFRWLLFIIIATMLYSKLFDLGLPARGAIGYGKFIRNETCFAGKPIAETYQFSQKMDLSACALIKSAEMEYENLISQPNAFSDIFEHLLLKYLMPLKEGPEKYYLLNKYWAERSTIINGDLRQIVLNSFWKHNKDIHPSVHIKIDNTEKYFRFLRFKKDLTKTKT